MCLMITAYVSRVGIIILIVVHFIKLVLILYDSIGGGAHDLHLSG